MFKEYKWEQGGKCSECGKPFDELHLSVKTTCGDKCRKARERRQRKSRAAWIRALNELALIRDSIKRNEDVTSYVEQLHRLRGEINDLLLLARDPDELSKRDMLYDLAKRSQ